MTKNVKGNWLKKYTSYRKLVLNYWTNPSDPTIYGLIDIDVTNLLQFIQKRREEANVKVTLTHAVIRAVAIILKKYPMCNVLVRGHKIWLRDDVDIFTNVAMPVVENKQKFDADLSGAMIRNADTLMIEHIAEEIATQAKKIRAKQDGKLAKTRKMISTMNGFFLRPILKFTYWLNYRLNRFTRFTPRDAFGGALVTTIGMFGIKLAYVPLVPFTAQPIAICIGTIEDRPVVYEGNIKIRKMCSITASLDHRVLDGFQSGILARALTKILENPKLLDQDPLEIDGI